MKAIEPFRDKVVLELDPLGVSNHEWGSVFSNFNGAAQHTSLDYDIAGNHVWIIRCLLIEQRDVVTEVLYSDCTVLIEVEPVLVHLLFALSVNDLLLYLLFVRVHTCGGITHRIIIGYSI